MKFASAIFLLVNFLFGQTTQSSFPTFYEWKTACDALPRYAAHAWNPQKIVLSEKLFNDQMDRF